MTKEKTLEIIIGPLPPDEDEAGNSLQRFAFVRDRGVSDWVLAEYVACKHFPSIDSCADEIVAKHGLTLTRQQLCALRTMVYFAGHANSDRNDAAEGWVNVNEAWLEAHVGDVVDVRGESIFGYSLKHGTVKRIGDRLYVVPPRARRRAFNRESIKVRHPRRPGLTPMPGAVQIIASTISKEVH